MTNKSISLTGIAKLPDFTFDGYPKSKQKIRESLKNNFPLVDNEFPEIDNFFNELEKAIRWSLFNQDISSLPGRSRAKIKKEIENITLEKIAIKGRDEDAKNEAIKEIINKTPKSLKGWMFSERSIHNAKTFHDVSKSLRHFKNKVYKELSGRGREQYQIPVLLAADIANALKGLGIKPVSSRPVGIANPTVFYQIVQECFRIAGLAKEDPYEHMKKSLHVKTTENL